MAGFFREGQVSSTILGLLLFITLHQYNVAHHIGFVIGNQAMLKFESWK
jgi:hypothetical protein